MQARRCARSVPGLFAGQCQFGSGLSRCLGRQALVVGWCPVYSGWEEAAAAGWRCRIDGVSVLVDDYVVVEPTQQDQQVGVVVTAVGLVNNVVRFEAVAGGAPVGLTTPVPEEDVVTGPGRDPVPISGDCFEPVSVDQSGLGVPNTEDLLEGVGTYFDPRPSSSPSLTRGAGTFASVNEDMSREPTRRRPICINWSEVIESQ